MSCENCSCGSCETERQEKEAKEQAKKVCNHWNWNCTPRECAEEAKELGWSTRTTQQNMERFGFNAEAVSQVVYEMEIGE